ncbi:MAG: galactofuranose ABC transporter, permease protein YjfF [Lachnospiraceae bacterium]|jgi:ribose/xylose/arabinose/galactoside ABC-type transport system permease subunit|nr:galactofuranose ABC transporter, permease protein YjfF [Lachnospiraceae bacterium]
MGNTKSKKKFQINNVSLLITIVLFILMFIFGSVKYDNFLSVSTFLNLFNDNAYLMIAGIGVTFVLITGGIDISISSTIAFTGVFSAYLLEKGAPAFVVIALVLIIGIVIGAAQGALIHYFKMQPFIVTLAGQFLMRGLCVVISEASIPISNPFFKSMALGKVAVKLGEAKALNGKIYYYVFILVAVLLISAYVLKCTKFGRSVYALGGNETSADLMGLNVARTKISAYAISSFCAALGGVVFSFYTLAGYGLQNMGMELDALSSAVIGGTLLTGGVGTVVGTTVGAMIQGIIQTIVTYQNLNTWWTKVTIAALLCFFIVIQRIIAIRAEKLKGKEEA